MKKKTAGPKKNSDKDEEKLHSEDKKNKNEEVQGNDVTFDTDFFKNRNVIFNEFERGVYPEISPFSTITVYGKRKTGKSVFAKWFLQEYRHEIPWAWVFTYTGFNAFYSGFIPKKFIIDKFGGRPLLKIMDRQIKAYNICETQMNSDHPNPINPRGLVVFDDYMGKDIKYNDPLKRYYMTGRHYACMTLFMTQYIKETPPVVRTNTDYCIFFNTDHRPSIDILFEEFAGKFDRNSFMQMMVQGLDQEHGFICINNDPNCKEHEKFFKGKADILDAKIDYIIGCQQYWQESLPQLRDIYDGKMQRSAELRTFLAKHRKGLSKDNESKSKIKDINDKSIYKEKSKTSDYNKLPDIQNN